MQTWNFQSQSQTAIIKMRKNEFLRIFEDFLNGRIREFLIDDIMSERTSCTINNK